MNRRFWQSWEHVVERMSLAAVLFFIFATLTRCVLGGYALYMGQVSWGEVVWALSVGWMFDAAPAGYLMLIILPFVLLQPRLWYRRLGGWCAYGAWLSVSVVLGLVAVGEFFFWEEFGSRYNFIAVDYLVYTHEVLHNILESYPVGSIVCALFVLMAGLMYGLRRWMLSGRLWRRRVVFFCLCALFLDLCHYSIPWASRNRYADELAHNGVYLLFHAFRHNELDYGRHYVTLDPKVAQDWVRHDLGIRSDDAQDPIAHPVRSDVPMRPRNVIVIMVESLSYEFLDQQSDGKYLTPYLRRLSEQSVVFEEHYATGTRTVRGLEAFTLSVPPTPGSSIVRRPNNAPLPTLASVLRSYGYESLFAYGGIGYFDNMNAFFGANGYAILDQLDIPKKENYFSNAWGVADEILFDEVLLRADEYAKKERPFFIHIMTTSNHRPFTFPSRPGFDWPQGRRDSAVAYTDFAIQKFIESARSKPWFKDSIFVVTADHCASSAGKTVIDVSKYHIPWMIYAPEWLTPRRIKHRSSQIDMAPTLLALLGASYESHFFGRNALKAGDSILPLGTYQNLGLWYQDRLVILSPKEEVACLRMDGGDMAQISCSETDITRAASWYQVASARFSEGVMQAVMKE